MQRIVWAALLVFAVGCKSTPLMRHCCPGGDPCERSCAAASAVCCSPPSASVNPPPPVHVKAPAPRVIVEVPSAVVPATAPTPASAPVPAAAPPQVAHIQMPAV